MSGYKQHYLDLHPSIFIHPAFSEIWRILSDIWKSIKFIQQISFEEKASIQQIGNFFSDSLNIPRLVHIYQNIKPPFLGWQKWWQLQKWFSAQTRMLAEKIYTLIYEYLNALIDANWARLIVNTNFHFGRRGSPLSFWPGEHQRREVFTPPEASTALLLGSDPRQWIVSSQPAVLRATKARQAQRKCATAAHSLRYQPQQTLVRRLRRGDNNRRKRRTEGGKRGAFGGKGGSGSRGAFQVTFRFSSLKPPTYFPEFIFNLESGYFVLESWLFILNCQINFDKWNDTQFHWDSFSVVLMIDQFDEKENLSGSVCLFAAEIMLVNDKLFPPLDTPVCTS